MELSERAQISYAVCLVEASLIGETMYQVSYAVAGSTRRKSYKTEAGAKRAIQRWLQQHKSTEGCRAILYCPDEAPLSFSDVSELDLESSQQANFYSSQAWRELRYQVLDRDNHRCACCGASPAHDPNIVLHVDHIKPRSKYPELAWDINNLQILCAACNLGKSNLSQRQWRE